MSHLTMSEQELEGLSVLNSTPTLLDGPNLLHELVQRTTTNNGPAIDFLPRDGKPVSLSYAELHEASDALAARISQELATLPKRRPGDQLIIPLMISQSPELYIATLAVLKAGGAFCPLNLDAPADRIKFILGDINASLVLAGSSLVDRIPKEGSTLNILLVGDEHEVSVDDLSEGVKLPTRIPAKDDLAYVMYTSGSTGIPKGVGVSHLAATQSLLAHDRHIPAFNRFLQFAAPTFDVSVFEIFFPLKRGATLVCSNRTDMLTDLPGVLRKMNVDACELTPSVAGSLLKSRSNAPNLKLILTIGEMLTQPVVSEFGGDPKRASMLWGMYGPTEAAIHCTLQSAFSAEASPSCIGFPLDTVSAFVIGLPVDPADPKPFSILPIGQIGELAVGGHQLATGYINNPEQTASAFINTPFGRVYKTGDKARMMPNGTIECLGRVAEGQIKLNGQRIELGEIQNVMLRAQGCHAAFVCVMFNVLIAFAAVDDPAGMQDVILATCKKWLSAFMVPTEIIVMEDFPRLPSGKIDRLRLKESYKSVNLTSKSDTQYRDDLERSLCETASQILQANVQTSTRLASVGLDSLYSIEFACQLRERGLGITTVDVLEAGTISDLHRLIQKKKTNNDPLLHLTNGHHAPGSNELLELLRGDPGCSKLETEIDAVIQCTALQTSMIVETLKDSRLYINQLEVRFPSNPTPSNVRSWIIEATQRNEILRTGFIQLDGSFVQIVWNCLADEQISIVDHFSPVNTQDAEVFLRRPFYVEILKGDETGPSISRITIHHALYDGWTFDLLLDDLTILAHGEAPPDRPQFRDIGKDLGTISTRNDHASAKEFWAEYLRGSPGSSLPNFRTVAIPRPEILTTAHKITVNPDAIRQISLQSGFSLQAVFQACLVWLWGAMVGTQDVTFGSVFSGRTLPISDIERVMGPCIQTLPVRVDISDSRTISELIHCLHSINRQIIRQDPLPLEGIKRAAGMPLSSKLFDVLFVYQESLASRKRGAGHGVVKEIWHKDSLETKLLVEIEPCDDHFAATWTWHSDAFDESQIESFARHFDQLVHHFSEHLNEPISSVQGSFPSQLLSTYTSGLESVETLSSIAELVEKAVTESPDAIALCFADSVGKGLMQTRTLTYAELNQTANQIARHLQACGVEPGGIVSIVMEKSLLLYCGILGILKTGCGYLPILPSTPIKRVHLILEQAQPQLCIIGDASKPFKDGLFPCRTIHIHDPAISTYNDTNLRIPGYPSQLAYIIYTSGTTGTPKGVSVTNKNLLSNIEVLTRIYPHDSNSKMLQACSQAFDVSVFEIFFTWANGMCLCAATNDTLFEDLERTIQSFQVTHLSMTVTVASLINPEHVPGVEFLVTSGEAMTDEVLAKWSKVLYQGYGPSETTNICTVRKVSPGDSSQYLGWSFENTSSFVMNPNSNELVPLGCIGELCFGGDQVAAGYLNMPELTAIKFSEHAQYGRLYRSGDLGRMLPDGSLIILGRLDTQVKLRGQRIELQEIQGIVLGSSLVRACACGLLNRRGETSQQLALFYVPSTYEGQPFKFLALNSELKCLNAEISQILQSSLPAYMVPSFLFPIASLPLTSSGKIDTARLRQTAIELSDDLLSQCSFAADIRADTTEWTKTELQIVGALVETLSVDRSTINRWSSFAALGLDSISAIPLARKLQMRLKARIPLSQILQNPSIGRLAQSFATAIVPANNSLETTLSVATTDYGLLPSLLTKSIRARFTTWGIDSVEAILPCTPLQEGMLASSGEGNSYCNQILFKIKRASQNRKILDYWNEMINRHAILRTCFAATEDPEFPFVQVVLPAQADMTEFNILSTDDTLSPKQGLQQVVDEHLKMAPSAVDSYKPPMSIAMINQDAAESHLSFVCHHALYDGVAMGILLDEIQCLATGKKLQAPPSFEPFLKALSLPSDVDDFWKVHFDSFSPLALLPSDGVKDEASSASTQVSGRCQMPLQAIEARLRELGVSLLSTCQAAWAATLAAALHCEDVCFGNVVSGRSIALDDIDRLVAPCFNTIPVRIELSRLTSNRDLMKRLQSLDATMLKYQFTPLRKVQNSLGLEGEKLFDTLLLLQPPAKPLDETIWTLEMERGDVDVPIVCELLPSTAKDVLDVIVHRDVNLFPESTTQLLCNLFIYAFNACLQFPSSEVDLVPNLPAHLKESLQKLPQAPKQIKQPPATATLLAEEPWTDEELTVRAVVSKLSRVLESKIGRHTSIYRLGLDSISAFQIAHILNQEGFTVSAVDVLESATCSGIVSRIQNSDHSKPLPNYDVDLFSQIVKRELSAASLPAQPVTILPCTPLQQGMISQFILSQGKSYFNFVSWTVNAGIDADRLLEAWTAILTRHEILRSGFVSVSHPDTSFAILTYSETEIATPIKVLDSQVFNMDEWRLGCARHALENLSLPPWQLALVSDAESVKMHMAIHHALYDAYSLEILMHELALLLQGNELPPTKPIQVAVSTIFGHMAAERTEAETFWKNKAANLVVNSFPVMTPLRVETRQQMHVSHDFRVSPYALREKAATIDATLQAVLQAAWVRVLSSYHGDAAVTFGVVLSGRSGEHLNEALFPRITTLPVMARNIDSNKKLLQSMMRYNASLRRYEHTPLSHVQRWIGSPNALLFDTILVFQQAASEDKEMQPWIIDTEKAVVEYPVSLEVEEHSSETMRMNLVFYDDILPTEQAELVLQQFDAMLMHLLNNPDGVADGLGALKPELFSLLPAEHDKLPTEVRLMHQFVEKSALNHPDKLALEFASDLDEDVPRRRWTYGDLNECGNRVANYLVVNGIKPGGTVAVLFDKCPEAYMAILGILKAGCAFVALDPSAPASRKEFILRDSGATALLVQGDGEEDLGFNYPIQVLRVALGHLSSYLSTTPILQREITGEDTCYCLYTSGTTGTPKGCLITHDNCVQAMLAFQHLFAGYWDAESRWLQFASFHFDVSVLEQYWSWSVGIAVVAAPRDLILSDLISTISTLDITHIDLTPSLARLVHPDDVPSLCKGVFITGGEQLRQDILDVWGEKGVIYNAYGPTEATIGVTMYCRVPRTGRSSNIGKQFPNVGAYVLRPGTDVPVLRGGVGELCISGKLVGKGYLNRDELTHERFPTLRGYGEKVYRTGDLVRVLHDGSFDFLGRADDQVKLRGQRLEIGEINHTIRSGVAQIVDVATLVTKHGNQDRDVLVSFVVTEVHQDRSRDLVALTDQKSVRVCEEAREACGAKLPGYMVPTYVLAVPFIPLSANNKAQASVLKQLFNDILPGTLSSHLSSTNEPLERTEPHLARVLAEVTGTEASEIKKGNTIFDLGIDSISVIKLARCLQAAGFSRSNPSAILRNPRLSALAGILRESSDISSSLMLSDGVVNQFLRIKQSILACYHRHLGAVCRAFAVDRGEMEYIAPCTPLQEGMLSRSTTADGKAAYFNVFQFDIASNVDMERLKDVWFAVVKDHSILRTKFLQTADGYVQVALKNPSFAWNAFQVETNNLSHFLENRYDQWVQFNSGDFQRPLEVDCIAHRDKQMLVIRIFHGLYDARSFDLVLKNVKAVYRQETTDSGPAFIDVLPHGPLCDYSGTRPFWTQLFEGFTFQPMSNLLSQTEIPTDTIRPDVVLSRELNIEGLERKRRELSVTQQAILQAAWIAVLRQRFTAWPTIGIVLSGRSMMIEGVENTIGPLFNTLPFRVKKSNPSSTWSDLIQETHQFNASVLSFVHAPLRQIQKWCTNGQPLFDTLFAFGHEEVSSGEEELWTEVASTSQSDYPLAIEATAKSANRVKITLVAQPHIATKGALSSLFDELDQALSSIAEGGELSILTEDSTDPRGSSGTTARVLLNQSHATLQDAQDCAIIWTDQAQKLRHEVAALAEVPVESVKGNTTLFELGLDSIDVVKLVARLRRIGLSLKTSELMKRPTINGILSFDNNGIAIKKSSTLQIAQLEEQSSVLKSFIKRAGHNMEQFEAILPPTPLQDSMVAEMLLSDFQRYFNHDILEFSSDTDTQKLKGALELVIANSPILRTTFVEVDDPNIGSAYCQVVRKQIDSFHIFGSLRNVDQLDDVIEHTRQKAAAAKGTAHLLQFTLATVAGQKTYLVFSIAHALYDGASLDMFHRDVLSAYDGVYNPRLSYAPTLGAILASHGEQAESFWGEFLQGTVPTLLASRSNAVALKQPKSTVHRLEFSSQVDLTIIKKFCARHGITAQALGQSCWAAVLASVSQSLDVVFGVVLSGRDTDEAQGLMFPTMNTVPVRVVLHGSTTEYLEYIWENLKNINEFQGFPLRMAMKLAGGGCGEGGKIGVGGALFNTLFTMQSRSGEKEDHVKEGRLWKSVKSAAEIEYPVCVEMELFDAGLAWRVACDESFLTHEQAGEIMGNLDRVLKFLVHEDSRDVLRFEEQGGKVSVCGLTPFSLNHPSKNNGAEGQQSLPRRDETWSQSKEAIVIVEVLAEVAGVCPKDVRPGMSIYHLGLDSISAIKVSAMLRKRGMVISVRDLVRGGSLGGITSKIQATQPTRTAEVISQSGVFHRAEKMLKDLGINVTGVISGIGLSKETVEMVLPALPVQVHMLSMWQNTEGELFFYQFENVLPSHVSKNAAKRAWSALVDEMLILRTTFAATGSHTVPFVQIVTRADQKQQGGEDDENPDVWDFKASSSPFVLLEASKSANGLVSFKLKIHHALYDGVSLPMLISSFKELCGNTASNYSMQAVTNNSLWGYFVLKHCEDGTRTKRKQFWTSYLDGARISLVSWFNQAACSSPGPKTRTVKFKSAAVNDINKLKITASTHGITIQALFFAAYAKVLVSKSTESARPTLENSHHDIVFGIYLSNRVSLHDELQNAPLPTLSIVPLRVRFEQDEDLISIAKEIQRDVGKISSFDNASVGLWEIEKWTGVKISSFVNFLSLPGQSGDGGEPSAAVDGDGVNLSLSRSPPMTQCAKLAEPQDVLTNSVRDIYLDAVDIEAAISSSLDVGVFGSGSLIPQAEAVVVIELIVRELEAAV
ncbi:amino acid adenylation domain-containing protein [Pseudomassariella vexata]|uniref:Amino acid adenylation domain-containing protein n=1 Tax=Pseudomassariella vexata TaxID=1141098 RepID=A0A1Y2DR66_9PEZI|nr:amino acid adenylation domain-containing protein [Pseudomassariella vexata]ORY61727.1 amino acid adenylation domain-containing protein [Pseudomassariella vexata]